ncbi:MAG: putative Glycosyltransferase [Rhizobium sp.]|nr:putative Glycosyltransferase [Rhizobium sp.]
MILGRRVCGGHCRHKKAKAAPANDEGGLSVIVTVHNEGNLLAKCLESCRRSLHEASGYYTFSEVLLICDNPDQRSWDLANLMVERGLATKVSRTSFGDPGLARNFGTQEAKGAFVTFIDADDLVSHAYLKDFLIRIGEADGAFLRPLPLRFPSNR